MRSEEIEAVSEAEPAFLGLGGAALADGRLPDDPAPSSPGAPPAPALPPALEDALAHALMGAPLDPESPSGAGAPEAPYAERRSPDRATPRAREAPLRALPAPLVLVGGSAGSGKSDLLETIAHRARAAGARALLASAAQEDRDRPHGTARALLLASAEPEAAEVLAALERRSADPAREEARRAALAARALVEGARRRPTLVLIDALERASEETLELALAILRAAIAPDPPAGGAKAAPPRLFLLVAARRAGEGAFRALARAAGGARGALEIDLPQRALLARPPEAEAPPPLAPAEALAAVEAALAQGAASRARRLARAALERSRDPLPGAEARRRGRREATAAPIAGGAPTARLERLLAEASLALAEAEEEGERRVALALEAATHLQRRAVDARAALGPAAAADLEAALGRALTLARRLEPAREALSRALDLAEAAQDPRALASVSLARAALALEARAVPAALDHAAQARELLARAPVPAPPLALAKVDALLARALIEAGDPARAAPAAARAALLASEAGEPLLFAEAQGLEAEAALAGADRSRALERAEAALEAARAAGHPRPEALAQERLGRLLLDGGEVEEAHARLLRATLAARRGGERRILARTLAGLGEAALRSGDPEAAVRAFDEAATIENTLAAPLLSAGPAVARAQASVPEMRARIAGYPAALLRLARGYLALGLPARTQACAARARKVARKAGLLPLEAEALRLEEDACALAGPLAATPLAGPARAAAPSEAAGDPALLALLADGDPARPPERWIEEIDALPPLPEGPAARARASLRALLERARAAAPPAQGDPGAGALPPPALLEGASPLAAPAPERSGPARWRYARIVGRSEPMRRLFLLLDRVGESGAPVLIHGESGTGKELVARAIHDVGPRRLGPFLSVNCAAMPETLLEAELFGHLKGAFTGAHEEKPGLFLAASGGTIFLDEIGETSPGMQAKLLRVLQEREVRPVGGSRVVKVDARVIAASNKDLARLVEAGLFRVDLFYRLNVIAVPVPPLRERREDIPLLLEHFLKAAAGSAGAPRREVGPGVLEALLRYPWPGNVRELENEVRRACALSGGRIELDDLSPPLRGERAPPPEEPPGDGAALTLEEQLEIAERRVLKEALLRVDGNKTRAAKELGLSRFGLLKKLDRYGLR